MLKIFKNKILNKYCFCFIVLLNLPIVPFLQRLHFNWTFHIMKWSNKFYKIKKFKISPKVREQNMQWVSTAIYYATLQTYPSFHPFCPLSFERKIKFFYPFFFSRAQSGSFVIGTILKNLPLLKNVLRFFLENDPSFIVRLELF